MVKKRPEDPGREERVAGAPPDAFSQGRPISPLLSTAGRSEQREAPRGATDQGTADSTPPGVCRPLLQLLPYVCPSQSAGQDPCHRPQGPICTLPDWLEVEEGSAEAQAQAAGPCYSHHCH